MRYKLSDRQVIKSRLAMVVGVVVWVTAVTIGAALLRTLMAFVYA